MPETPTFGRYAEIPYERMTPEQQEGYRFLKEVRGQVGGPSKIWVHNPKLVKAAAPLMRGGRVSRMPLAVDNANGNLALPFGQRVMAGMEMGSERRRGLRQFGVVHPDLARPANLTTDLLHKAIAFLLLGGHLLIGDLGVAAKGRCIGHFGFLL